MRKVVVLAFVFLMGSLWGALAQAWSTNPGATAAATSAPQVSPTEAPASPQPAPAAVTSGFPISTVNVAEGDMYLRPSTTGPIRAGAIRFVVTNSGSLHHEFVIVSGDPTGTKGDEPSTVSEANHIGGPDGPELGDVHPGQTRTLTVHLGPGTYTAMCNYPGHYAAGMHFQFVVKSATVFTVKVAEGDMHLHPSTTGPIPAGIVRFVVTNGGSLHHEFVIVSGDPTGTTGDEPGTVSEANHIGGPDGPELGDVHPGQTRTVTVLLVPGTYTAMCNYPGHYAAGMHFQLVVQ